MNIGISSFLILVFALSLRASAGPARDVVNAADLAPDTAHPEYAPPQELFDYHRREEMIPMRDGIKLKTIFLISKKTRKGPLLLQRTPYNASKASARFTSPHLIAAVPSWGEIFAEDDYLFAFQDIRGKHGSEGDYIMTRPLRGPLNCTQTDHSTDTYDTIEWILKNIPESNGNIGIIGTSYLGFTATMALIDPHPALKAVAAHSPMVDSWMGDDFFQYGAFRQGNFDYYAFMLSEKAEGKEVLRTGNDDFDFFLRLGSAGNFAKHFGLDQIPYVKKVMSHPSYDAFWADQALDRIIPDRGGKVPTIWLQGLWDQEDIWGAIHIWLGLKEKGKLKNNHLVLGPWRHGQENGDGSHLGDLTFQGDTALEYRRRMLKPFFDHYLKKLQLTDALPNVLVYDTGENRWEELETWPSSCEKGCPNLAKPLYLKSQFGLGFDPVDEVSTASQSFDEYLSDPKKPIPFRPRPISPSRENWQKWLVTDQRHISDRPDVLVYETPPLENEIFVSGIPKVKLVASTSGTDSDWVVKLIDVFPDQVPSTPNLGGYQLPITQKIFRGRYRKSFKDPEPLTPNTPLDYSFELTPTHHTFKKGHRMMVQIQSSQFPLYDRNPQTFVKNIFFAEDKDYVKATQRVYRGSQAGTFILLPVVGKK